MLFHHANAFILPFRDFLDTLKTTSVKMQSTAFFLPHNIYSSKEGTNFLSMYKPSCFSMFHVNLRFLMSFETYLVFCDVSLSISKRNPYPHSFSIGKGGALCASSFCSRGNRVLSYLDFLGHKNILK